MASLAKKIPSIAMRTASRMQKGISVEWEDGLAAQFSYVWLRDNCAQRPALLHLDLQSKPDNCCADANKLSMSWPPYIESTYTSAFLRTHANPAFPTPVDEPCPEPVLPVPWTVLPFFPRNEVFKKGALAKEMWTEHGHEAGTRWPQFERIPSAVTVESHTKGAKITVVDAVEALSAMSEAHPEEFEFLTKAPIQYHADLFKATHRLVNIKDGRIAGAIFNNELRSADITVDKVDFFFESLKTFHKVCLDRMKSLSLDPGSVLVCDNRQTLIGAPAQLGRRVSINVYQ